MMPGNRYLQQAMVEVVENQLRDLNPPETKQLYDRLKTEGFSDKETRRLIGCVVATEIFGILRNNREFDQARFAQSLSTLPDLPED